jgi:hypothetical protein
LYGKQHLGVSNAREELTNALSSKSSCTYVSLQKISNRWKQSVRSTTVTRNTDNSSSYSLDESSLDAAPMMSPRRSNSFSHTETSEATPPTVTDSMVNVMKTFQGWYFRLLALWEEIQV